MTNILLAVLGFVLLLKCADFFVDGAASLAKNFKIPTVVIGLTIIAFGTSAPELAISFSSHLSDNADMLFGNVIGSSISNIFVILGVTALIFPIKIERAAIKKELPLLLFITIIASLLFLDMPLRGAEANTLSRVDGIVLILLFCIFGLYLAKVIKNDTTEDEKPKHKLPKAISLIALGLAGIIAGSELVVTNAALFAESIGISQKIISVTIISVGTSLPELITAITAVKKGEDSMAIGSIVGSSIFNICIVLGLPVLFLGEISTTAFGAVDVGFMVLAAVLLLVFAATGRTIKRWEGLVLLALYSGYVGYILLQ